MSTVLATTRWLSILTGALSLFYLGHAWFEFGLDEVFHRVHEWYAGLVHPVVEVLKPVAVWLVALLGMELPIWWKDAVGLYLAMGGATTRATPQRFDSPNERLRVVANRPEFGVWAALALLPIRFIAWPMFWLLLDQLLRRRFLQTLKREIDDETLSAEYYARRGSLAESSLFEFAMIFAGALIFAGLNAGL